MLFAHPCRIDRHPGHHPDSIRLAHLGDYLQLDRQRNDSLHAILESWRLEGYTHLLVHRAGAKFIRLAGSRFFIEEDWVKLENLFSALPSPIEIGGSYQLYPLPKDNP